jgi:threonine/homoserine/homoserine lactone efflux protein
MNLSIDLSMALAYLWFAWVGAVTPGPNTMVALACAIHFGPRSIRAHMIGVVLGVSLMMLVVLSGAQALIQAVPIVGRWLQWLGVGWLIWLGIQLARTDGLSAEARVRPPKAWESALFQWANPKAWMVISGAAVTWRGIAQPVGLDMLILVGGFAGSCALALVLWAQGGERLSRWLRQGRRLIGFNRLLGMSLVATAAWLAAGI